MTEYELNTLIILSGETSGGMIEFWVSVSFAVVVASFFISKQVNVKIFQIMRFLYLLSSLFMASIYIGSAIRASYYFNHLVSLGVDVSHIDNPVSITSVLMAATLFLGGTIATMYYINYCAQSSDAGSTSTST